MPYSFNPRTHESATVSADDISCVCRVSIHALMRVRRLIKHIAYYPDYVSIHALMRVRPSDCVALAVITRFQSTHS